MSLPKNTGNSLHVGKRLSYACNQTDTAIRKKMLQHKYELHELQLERSTVYKKLSFKTYYI